MNREYWLRKIERNIQRDQQVNEALRQKGWLVLRFWDFEVRERLPAIVAEVQSAVASR
jgi:G:T-mismatch repair DNA endonuclease (very short patch repair protein)